MKNAVRGLTAVVFLLGLGVHLQSFAQNATFSTPLRSTVTPTPPSTTGRLFFSAERRQALDSKRTTRRFQETVVEGDALTFNGLMTRSSGKWTLWVNGNPIHDQEGSSIAATPLPGKAAQIQISATGESAQKSIITVGNTIERSSGQSSSLLGNGSIRVSSRAGDK